MTRKSLKFKIKYIFKTSSKVHNIFNFYTKLIFSVFCFFVKIGYKRFINNRHLRFIKAKILKNKYKINCSYVKIKIILL